MSNLIAYMVFLPLIFGAMAVFIVMFLQRLIEAVRDYFED